MKKEVYLHVPEPCHENWDNMSPLQQGRFCQSCSKQVTDFSKMTDKQILQTLSNASGKTCGRFAAEQLQRPVVNEPTAVIRPYKIFLSAFIPAFLLANSGTSQQLMGKVRVSEKQSCEPMIKGEAAVVVNNRVSGKVTDGVNPLGGVMVLVKGTKISVITKDDGSFSFRQVPPTGSMVLVFLGVGYSAKEVPVTSFSKPLLVNLRRDIPLTMGLVAVQTTERAPTLVKVKVTNEHGEPLPYATIQAENIEKTFVCDKKGYSKMEVPPEIGETYVVATHVGYKQSTKRISVDRNRRHVVEIVLTANETLPDVTVVGYPAKGLQGITGGLSYVTKVSRLDTARTFLAKAFKNEMFKVYPNPLKSGGEVNLVFKRPGEYTVQVFNNAGSLFMSKDVRVSTAKQVFSIPLPSTLGRGSYYIKAVDNNRKHFVDKLVLQ